jgi:enoyl-[acyl-carrier protein] reductase II
MGAEGAQLGTRFVASEEASSHFNFKKAVINSQEGDTLLTMKQLTPVRLLRNKFFQQVQQAEWKGASEEELKNLLGRARAKKGMFEGDLEEGELEIGQASALVRDILPAKKIVEQLWQEWMDGMEDPVRKL